jgi:hypothetical protein
MILNVARREVVTPIAERRMNLSRQSFLDSLIVLLVLSFIGCSDSGTDPVDSALRPALDFPEDWTEQQPSGIILLLATSPMEGVADPFRENVNVVVEQYVEGRDFGQYVAGSMLSLSTALSSYSTIESDEAELAGRSARRIIYTGRLDNITLYNLAYIVDGGNRAWTITCSATPESIDTWIDTFEGIVASFRLE